MKQRRKTPEHDLQVDVIGHLERRAHRSVFFCSIPNGALMQDHIRRRLVEEGLRPGSPDLLLIKNGGAFGLELKAKGGRKSDDQRLVERAWSDAGGTYACVWGIDQATAKLVEWGLIKPDRGFIGESATHAGTEKSTEYGKSALDCEE